MCGVFGFFSQRATPRHEVQQILSDLYLLSESRGKEASGCAVFLPDRIEVIKRPETASQMLKSPEYRLFFDECFPGDTLNEIHLMGHSRLVTNGSQAQSANNQPVVKDDLVVIHNGIIVNDQELWIRHPDLSPRQAAVDTEVFAALVRHYVKQNFSYAESFQKAFLEIRGATTIAMLCNDKPYLYLGTNNGSLYYLFSDDLKRFVFASELVILRNFTRRHVDAGFSDAKIVHIPAGSGLILHLGEMRLQPLTGLSPFVTTAEKSLVINDDAKVARKRILCADTEHDAQEWRARLKRCSKCLIPETFPFIHFNNNGECTFCQTYRPFQPPSTGALERVLERHRKPGDKPDCLVAISGGRDSCYGLHYVKEVLGLKPIAFTYDWGMVTDLARRNVARMCGQLGVEHILVSADIKQKRLNVRRNIHAWLKKPDLGLVPLLMAGDKQYFSNAHRLAKEYDIQLMFFFPNRFEQTKFKSGFCGVQEHGDMYFQISFMQKMQMVSYYLKRFLTNPRYINSSLFDTARSFFATYFAPNNDICYLYDYIGWDEQKIMQTITDIYDWERANDTTTTWRIGDGTSSFYNLIYLTMAGFTENDTYYSHHIRDGLMTREQAEQRLRTDNQIRMEAIEEYARTVGFDMDDAIRRINAAPKLYGPYRNGAVTLHNVPRGLTEAYGANKP